MTHDVAIIYLRCMKKMALDDVAKEVFDIAIKALENQKSQIDLEEYKSRLVSKYSDGDEATDFDNGITMALDLLEEMEDERS